MTDLGLKLIAAAGRIERAIELHQPKNIFALFSGGHDSGSCTHFATEVLGDRLTGVVHVNTGIGIPQTRQYVRETCERYGWNLLEYKAAENTNAKGEPDPQVYEDIVLRFGFPGSTSGPNGHGMMYARLKERQVRRLCRDFGVTSKEPAMLISGCREEESNRRMGIAVPLSKQGRQLWVNPFWEFSGADCSEYMADREIPRNPVKDLLHMSGECLCGAFAHPGELAEIELWYPEVAAGIKRIEARVRAAGFPWGWEDDVPDWWLARKRAAAAGQQDAFEEEAEAEIQHLCMGCGKRAEAR